MEIPKVDACLLNNVPSLDNVTISGNTIIGQQVTVAHPKTSNVEPIWFGMKPLVSEFIGRMNELDQIHTAFSTNPSKPVVITGLGGSGKSELALKFAYRHKEKFENVIWINAGTEQDLRMSFEELASELKMSVDSSWQTKQLVKQVYKNLKNKKSSLLIFDDVESWKDGSYPIYDLLPTDLGPGPHVLITSRNSVWGLPVTKITLDAFSVSEAVKFIKNCLQLRSEADLIAARNLADLLGCLPIALQQAVAYILREIKNPPIDSDLSSENVKSFCIENFIKDFNTQKQQQHLLDYQDVEGYGDRNEKTVLITWRMTLEKITKLNVQAINLMTSISYLRPNNINLTMLKKFHDFNRGELEEAVSILDKYSMIKRDVNTISVNRMVQTVVRLNNKEREQSILSSLLKRFAKIVHDNSTENWFIGCLPHAHMVWERSLEYEKLLLDFQDFSIKLFDQSDACGMYYFNLSLLQKNLQKYDILFESNEITTLLTTRLVTTLWRIDRNEEAVSIGENEHQYISQKFGPDHPLSVDLLNNIAIAYHKMGQYQKALTIYNDSIDVYMNSPHFGPNHANTHSTMYKKANLLRRLGKLDDALEIFQYELEFELEKDEPDESFVLDIKEQIAFTLNCQGNFTEALAMHNEVYEERKKLFGRDNGLTVSSACGIAECLCNLKQWNEANDVLQGVKDEKALPTEYLIKHHLMGRISEANGKTEEAIEIVASALEESAYLGNMHWQILKTEIFLGELIEKCNEKRIHSEFREENKKFHILYSFGLIILLVFLFEFRTKMLII